MAFISDEHIAANKELFIKLIRGINREGANIDGLLDYLESSDFYEAPASAKYHNSCKGGLCAHSLNVYDNLCTLYTHMINPSISEEEYTKLRIVSLLHDISKINTYEKTFQNKKIYSENGSKSDENGRFDWVSVPGYATRPANQRMILGNHEQNAEYLARCFIPLTIDESSAILHHMGGMSWDSSKDAIGDVFTAYPIALLLYQADMLSTYINEKE